MTVTTADSPESIDRLPARETKLLIAEHKKFLFDSLHNMIRQSGKHMLVEHVSNHPDLQTRLQGNRYDLVLLNMGLESMKGFLSIKNLIQDFNDTRFLITVEEKLPVFQLSEIMDIGACGVFSFETNGSSIADVINIVLSGEKYIPYEMIDSALKTFQDVRFGNILTPREKSILALISQGLTNMEIAEYTGLKCSTVKVHNRSIFLKLKVNTRTEAAEKYLTKESGALSREM